MAVTPAHRDASTALRQFGLGARSGEITKIAGDPRGFVLASLSQKQAILLDDVDLNSSDVLLANAQLEQRQRRIARERPQEAMREAMQVPEKGTRAARGEKNMNPGREQRIGGLRRLAYQDEAAVRFDRLVTTDHAVLERLTQFWSNHFCVSVTKVAVMPIAGAFEREAIRPHVLGRFVDMLLAVEQHPAMLIYLDNNISFGPNSEMGRNRKRGLNENLAREIMELHTLGVNGGYSQNDVTNLARIITGWTVSGIGEGAARAPGRFLYQARRREPGAWPLFGKSYGDPGVETGRQALRDLAKHPSTARHIATKLAAHFVSDPPQAGLVAALEKRFRETDGDLAEVSKALLTAEAAWLAPPVKMMPPNDYLVALVRGMPFAQRPKSNEIVRLSDQLGQRLWGVPSPKGWPDSDDAWAGPSPLRERLRIAEVVSRQLSRDADPRAHLDALMASAASDATRKAIERAETREQAFELMMMSPEFQRR